MTYKLELVAMLAKVKAGNECTHSFAKVLPVGSLSNNWLHDAYNGSLDAALNLHNSKLGEWETSLWQESNLRHEVLEGKWRCRLNWLHGKALVTVGNYGREAEGQDDVASRAWLIAIIEALIILEK